MRLDMWYLPYPLTLTLDSFPHLLVGHKNHEKTRPKPPLSHLTDVGHRCRHLRVQVVSCSKILMPLLIAAPQQSSGRHQHGRDGDDRQERSPDRRTCGGSEARQQLVTACLQNVYVRKQMAAGWGPEGVLRNKEGVQRKKAVGGKLVCDVQQDSAFHRYTPLGTCDPSEHRRVASTPPPSSLGFGRLFDNGQPTTLLYSNFIGSRYTQPLPRGPNYQHGRNHHQ